MSRPMPSGLDDRLKGKYVGQAVFLLEIDWPDVPVYMWNGYADLIWGGKTWKGLGHLGTIADIKEAADGTANGFAVTLSGIPSAYTVEVLRNDVQGRQARLYFGVIDGASFTVDPVAIFDGFVDVPTIVATGTTSEITINLEREQIDNRSGAHRYTDSDQKFYYPTDRGLEFVAGIAAATLTWGKATVYSYGGGGGGDGGDGGDEGGGG